MIAIERALVSPLVSTRIAAGLAQRARPSCARIAPSNSLLIGLDRLAPKYEYRPVLRPVPDLLSARV
jgi:hypothetical protein